MSPVSAPTPRRLFAPAIRFRAGPSYRVIVLSCYRVIAISLFPSGRYVFAPGRRIVLSCYRVIVLSLYRCSHPVDTSIRRYVDTSIRRYVDTHCSTWNGVTALRRYVDTALRRYVLPPSETRYVVLSFSIPRKIISQKHGPLFKIGTRGVVSAADPSRRAAGPPGRRAVVTS